MVQISFLEKNESSELLFLIINKINTPEDLLNNFSRFQTLNIQPTEISADKKRIHQVTAKIYMFINRLNEDYYNLFNKEKIGKRKEKIRYSINYNGIVDYILEKYTPNFSITDLSDAEIKEEVIKTHLKQFFEFIIKNKDLYNCEFSLNDLLKGFLSGHAYCQLYNPKLNYLTSLTALMFDFTQTNGLSDLKSPSSLPGYHYWLSVYNPELLNQYRETINELQEVKKTIESTKNKSEEDIPKEARNNPMVKKVMSNPKDIKRVKKILKRKGLSDEEIEEKINLFK